MSIVNDYVTKCYTFLLSRCCFRRCFSRPRLPRRVRHTADAGAATEDECVCVTRVITECETVRNKSRKDYSKLSLCVFAGHAKTRQFYVLPSVRRILGPAVLRITTIRGILRTGSSTHCNNTKNSSRTRPVCGISSYTKHLRVPGTSRKVNQVQSYVLR